MIDRSRKHSKSDRAKGKKHALRARKNFQKQTRDMRLTSSTTQQTVVCCGRKREKRSVNDSRLFGKKLILSFSKGTTSLANSCRMCYTEKSSRHNK